MRRILLTAALLFLTAGAVVAQNTEIPWHEGQSWDEIVAKATTDGRNILIDFFATWCGPCKMLDNQVYNQPEVVEALADVVTFKVDVDKPEYKDLTTKFGVKAMPTLVVCRPDGSEIDRFLGFRPADLFITTVDDYRHERNTYDDLTGRLAKAPDDLDLLFKLGTKHSERSETEAARRCFNHILELDADNSAGFAAQTLPALAEMSAMANDFDGAADFLGRALTSYPDDVDQDQLLPFLAWAQGRAGRKQEQVETYRTIVGAHPDDAQSLNALAWSLAELEVDLAEATDYALKAAELSDNDPNIIDTVAEVYLKRGMKDEALKWIDAALQKDPENKDLQQRKAQIEQKAAD